MALLRTALAILMGVVATLATLGGCLVAVGATFISSSVNRGHDICYALQLFIIGAFCAFVCRRWLRADEDRISAELLSRGAPPENEKGPSFRSDPSDSSLD